MRVVRVVALPCLLGVALSTAVGPGLSLVRCHLTGRVSIDCCCSAQEAAARVDLLGDEPFSCCTFTRLAAPWRSVQVSSPAAQPAAPLAAAFSDLGPSPWAGPATPSPIAPPFEPPPRWLRAARV